MAFKIYLRPGETMREYRHRQALWLDSLVVVSVVDNRPGIPSKDEIAVATGLDPDRIAECLSAVQSNDTPFRRIDYGQARAKSGPYAGQQVIGWFPMIAAYQGVMKYADWHSAKVEAGVRRSRHERLLWAKGLNSKQAKAVVAEIEDRMKVPVDKLSAAEAKVFEQLADKQAIEVIKNGSL